MTGEGSVVDRIAAAIRIHEFDPVYDLNYQGRCAYTNGGYACDWRGTADEHPAHVAGEVAKALQLTEEWRVARYTDGIRSVAIPLDSVTSDAETLLNCYRGSVLEARSVSPWVSVPQEEQ